MNFKKLLGITLGTAVVAGGVKAEGVKNITNKAFNDSTITAKMKAPGDSIASITPMLKAGEKYKEIDITREFGDIRIIGMILVSMPSDTAHNYYEIVYETDNTEMTGEDVIKKESEIIETMGLTPASPDMLNAVNSEAFNKTGKKLKTIATTKTGENLGQNRPIPTKDNTVVLVRTEVGTNDAEINEMGSTLVKFSTLVYGPKSKTGIPETYLASNNK